MDVSRFDFLPESTNAVEAYNRLSKTGKGPNPLSVAIMSLYKKDMVAVLQDLAEKAGMPTTYEDRSISARQKRAKLCSIARKKRQFKVGDNAQGPPDRNSDYTRKRKRTDAHKKVCRAHS